MSKLFLSNRERKVTNMYAPQRTLVTADNRDIPVREGYNKARLRAALSALRLFGAPQIRKVEK